MPRPPTLVRPTLQPRQSPVMWQVGRGESQTVSAPDLRLPGALSTEQVSVSTLGCSLRQRNQIKRHTAQKVLDWFFFFHLNKTGKEKPLKDSDQGHVCQELEQEGGFLGTPSKHVSKGSLPTKPKLEGYQDATKHRKLFYRRVPGLDTK